MDIKKRVLALLSDLNSESQSDEEENIFIMKKRKISLHNYVDVIDGMNGSDFQSHFRLQRTTFDSLENQISPILGRSCKKDLLMVLWVLATPDSYRSIADRFGVSKSSLWISCNKMWTVIASMSRNTIKWPSISEMRESAANFQGMASFPGVIGCIDGTHIPIKAPTKDAEVYINRKDFHSVILQAVANSKLEFIDCYVGEVGSVHDARVFRKSKLGQSLQERIPGNYHLLGDSAYPLSANLLTPIRDNGHLTTSQMSYNRKLSKTRSTIERAFAYLKGRFRRLKYLDMWRTDLVPTVVIACCVLHNVSIGNDGVNYDGDIDCDDDDDDDKSIRLLKVQNQEGIEKRFDIMKSFNSLT